MSYCIRHYPQLCVKLTVTNLLSSLSFNVVPSFKEKSENGGPADG